MALLKRFRIFGNQKVLVALLIIVGFLTYANSFQNQFVWDDDHFIYQNFLTHSISWSNTRRIFTSNTIAGAGQISDYYRPLTTFSFALDHLIWGWNVFGFHLTNTVLHISCAVLIFFLLKKLGLSKMISFWIALLFLVHPVQTEAVTYLSSRGDILYALFHLISLYLFITAFEKLRGRFILLSMSVLFFVMSILGKEAGLGLVPVCAGVLFLQKIKSSISLKEFHETYRSHVLVFLILVFLSVIYLILRLTVLNFHDLFNFTGSYDAYTRSLAVRLFTFSKVLWIYVGLLFFPYPLYLERDTTFVLSAWSLPVAGIAALLLVLIIAAIYEIQKKHTAWTVFGLIFFAAHILPVSGIIPMTGIFHENWLYMPMIGFMIVLFRLAQLVISPFAIKRFQLFLYGVGIIVVIIFSTMTMIQNTKWKDRITYFEHNLRFTESARLHLNVGNSYLAIKKFDKAQHHLNRAVALADIYPQTHFNLGKLYEAQGKIDMAEEEHKKSLSLNPEYLYSYPELLNIYLKKKDYKQALPYLQKLSAVYPVDSRLMLLYGNLLYKLDKKTDAEKVFEKVIKEGGNKKSEIEKRIDEIKKGKDML